MENAPVSFWILFAITIAGLASTQVLLSKLAARHPVTFAKLGSPHLIANNTPKNNWLQIFGVRSHFRRISQHTFRD